MPRAARDLNYDRYDAAYDSFRKPQHRDCLAGDCAACAWEEDEYDAQRDRLLDDPEAV